MLSIGDDKVHKGFVNQTELSGLVGWNEESGRRWIKIFEDYLPYTKKGKTKLYNHDSITTLFTIKKLSEKNFTSSQILEIFKEYELPINDEELNNIISSKFTLNNYEQSIYDSIPSPKEFIIPILSSLKDKKTCIASKLNTLVANHFNLTDEQLSFTYPDSREYMFTSRLRAARYSLLKQNYIEEINKLTYQITDKGIVLLNESSEEIKEEIEELEKVIDPLEIILESVEEIETALINKLVEELKKAHWRKLEIIVIDLLTAMGYGDGRVTEKTNDGGLDGVIKEDKLGLDNIYVQAKRWEQAVGRPDVMSFSGALDAKGARKGIFITTSNFTQGAEEYVERLESKKIILIGGKKLARLMIENNIGVSTKKKIVVKEIDFSYFEGE